MTHAITKALMMSLFCAVLFYISWMFIQYKVNTKLNTNSASDLQTPPIFQNYDIIFTQSTTTPASEAYETLALKNTFLKNKKTGALSSLLSQYPDGHLFASAVVTQSKLYLDINTTEFNFPSVGDQLWIYDDQTKAAHKLYIGAFIWSLSVSTDGRIGFFQQNFCESDMMFCGTVKLIVFGQNGLLSNTIDLKKAGFCPKGGISNIDSAGWKGDNLTILCVGGDNDYDFWKINRDTFQLSPHVNDPKSKLGV